MCLLTDRGYVLVGDGVGEVCCPLPVLALKKVFDLMGICGLDDPAGLLAVFYR